MGGRPGLMLMCGPRCLPRGWGAALGTPVVHVLASRRLLGRGWARSRRIPDRVAPPSSRPGGRRLPPPSPPLLDHGRWWPQAPQATRTDRTALPSPPLPGSQLLFHLPDPVGWTHSASAGPTRHRLDTLGIGRTALFPPRQRGPDWRDAAPRSPRSPAAATARRRPGAAQRPGQCPAQSPPSGQRAGPGPLSIGSMGGGHGDIWDWVRFSERSARPHASSRRPAGRAGDPARCTVRAPWSAGAPHGHGWGKVSPGFETVVSPESPERCWLPAGSECPRPSTSHLLF